MNSLLKSLVGLVLVVVIAVFGVKLWMGEIRWFTSSPTETYKQQMESDIDFFQEKVSSGNWVFGAKLAQLQEQAFRLTNDYRYLVEAQSSIREYLTHEEISGAFALLSSLSLTQHEFEQARMQALRARELAHSFSDKEQSLAALFDAQLALGDIMGLRESIEELRQLSPEPTFGVLVREARYVDRMKGDVATAAIYFGKACDQIQDSDDVWTRAWCLTHVGIYRFRGGEAVENTSKYFDRLDTEIYPGFNLALEVRGHLSALQGNYVQAKEYYNKALEKGGSPDSYLELAEIALLQQDAASARAAWMNYVSAIGAHRVAVQSSSSIVHVRGLVQALYGIGEREKALAEANKDLEKRPNDPTALQTLALLHAANGNFAEALAVSLRIPSDVSLTGEEAFVRGISLQKLGKIEEAAPYLAIVRSKDRDLSLRTKRMAQELH